MQSIRHVLSFLAHPDDETVMVGGTLAMLHAAGVGTHLLCATRGEGGERGDPPVVSEQALLGPVREQELRCATDKLGLTSLTMLDYVDPVIGPGDTLSPFDANFDTLVGQLVDHAQVVRADVLLTHGPDGEYGHPAHKLIFRAARAAVNECPGLLHYSVAARVPGIEDRLWNESRTAHLVLDITPWAAAKIAAMECHTSQHALFKRRRKLAHVREALRAIESFYCESPAVNGTSPEDAFARLLLASGAESPAVQP